MKSSAFVLSLFALLIQGESFAGKGPSTTAGVGELVVEVVSAERSLQYSGSVSTGSNLANALKVLFEREGRTLKIENGKLVQVDQLVASQDAEADRRGGVHFEDFLISINGKLIERGVSDPLTKVRNGDRVRIQSIQGYRPGKRACR